MLRLQVEKRRRQRAQRAGLMPSRPGTAGISGQRSNSDAVPADELYERYLARAISEVNALGDEIARRGDAPSRQPVLGSGHPLGDIFLLKHDPTPAELTEGVAFYGRVGQAVLKSVQRLDIDPLLVYGTNVVKLGGDHGRDESELAERVYPMWLLRELHIVQPKIVVVMGEDTLAVVNGLDLALAKPLEPELGVVQHLTPTIEALSRPRSSPRSTTRPPSAASGPPSAPSASGTRPCRRTDRDGAVEARDALDVRRVREEVEQPQARKRVARSRPGLAPPGGV